MKTIRPPLAAGDRYGKLTAVRCLVPGAYKVEARWLFRCDCGTEKDIRATSVRGGLTVSCGCQKSEKARARLRKHGRSHTSEYYTWQDMIRRCTDPRRERYPDYGGRGIMVCNRWRFGESGKHGFECWLEDMGTKPSPQHSMDRYPNKDGNYEPSNVRWATDKQQNRNRRNARILLIDGKELTLPEAAETAGLPRSVVKDRLRLGWDVKLALSSPIGFRPSR